MIFGMNHLGGDCQFAMHINVAIIIIIIQRQHGRAMLAGYQTPGKHLYLALALCCVLRSSHDVKQVYLFLSDKH